MSKKAKVHYVHMSGIIQAGKKGEILNLGMVRSALEKAFLEKGFGRKPDLVLLKIDSPGGLPSQSEEIANYIRHLSDKTGIPVVVCVADVAASGGYWLAVAGDEIYALNTSFVGSIGVIAASFGFSHLMSKAGIDRRVLAEGKFKAGPDSFLPADPEKDEEVKRLMKSLQESFVTWIKARRGDKLKLYDEEIFNGRVWTGAEALEIGLIDGIMDMNQLLNKKFPDGYDIQIFSVEQNTGFFARLTSQAASLLLDHVLAEMKSRAGWRFF